MGQRTKEEEQLFQKCLSGMGGLCTAASSGRAPCPWLHSEDATLIAL